MPKRELRPQTVLKMQQQKEKELQEKQARLTQPSQQPLSTQPQLASVQAMPPPQPVAQPIQQTMQQVEQASQLQQQEPIESMSVKEESSQEEAQPEISQVREVVEQPKIEQQPAEVKKEEPWHPQMLMPAKEAPTVANVLHVNVDMSRIENLTRSIMYRDPQKSGFAKKGAER